MTPQEVQERLKLNQLKDKIWYVVPSCATTGEGLFEGLVSYTFTHVQSLQRRWRMFADGTSNTGLAVEQRQDSPATTGQIDTLGVSPPRRPKS